MSGPFATRWAGELELWAIPEPILNQAPEPPWPLPAQLFQVDVAKPRPETPSTRAARSALGDEGTVLDVGCGGGAASLPLAPWAGEITGVDQSPEMLVNFATACDQAGVHHVEVEGLWPDAAAQAVVADVVVCHHVVYNVPQLGPFLEELTRHARRLVVVELTDHHPTSGFNDLWQRFWDLSRPTGPVADLFVEVVRELGWNPTQERFRRSHEPRTMTKDDYLAFARRRLCLGADRDPELSEALGESWPLMVPGLVTVTWRPDQRRSGG
ncbi:MAG TPA: methyltransferase domain-containing protein [Candidatus Dormibacteraeota bacterium]|nr:methyltransferase domain-containing protein [Candidatus Dormibacteraeota bacterium]